VRRRGAAVFSGSPHRDSDPPPRGHPRKYFLTLLDIHQRIALKPILRIVIFISGFDAVMPMAKRLPVTLIPEELVISSMRDDVVNVGCLNVLAFPHALNAQGVCLKVSLACLLPCSAIASACC